MGAASISVKVFDKDRGAKTLLARLAKATRPTVKVGVFGAAADRTHADSKLTNVEVASVHEFGATTGAGVVIPERSFIRGTVDENRPKIHAIQRRVALAFLTGKASQEQGLGIIGEAVKSQIQGRISQGIHASPASGVDLVSGKTPLIATGQLRQSINWEIAKP